MSERAEATQVASQFQVVDDNKTLRYLDSTGDLDLAVFSTGTSVVLWPGQFGLIAKAVGIDVVEDQAYPYRVVCSPTVAGGCGVCAEPKCVPLLVPPPPPPAPLANAGQQPTPMVLGSTLTISASSIVAEDGTTILVFDLDGTPTGDSVARALFAVVGQQDPAVYFHVYVVSPSDTPPPPALEFPQGSFKIFAIPVVLPSP